MVATLLLLCLLSFLVATRIIRAADARLGGSPQREAAQASFNQTVMAMKADIWWRWDQFHECEQPPTQAMHANYRCVCVHSCL